MGAARSACRGGQGCEHNQHDAMHDTLLAGSSFVLPAVSGSDQNSGMSPPASGSAQESWARGYALSDDARVATILASVVLFLACFVVAWMLFQRHSSRFSLVSSSMKADLASRAGSTLHSLIIVPALIHGVWGMPWAPASMAPLGPPAFLQRILCLSVGYFIADSITTVAFRVPQWIVFFLHHIAATTPYVVYLFVSPCDDGLFILSCFLLVEITNVPLNAQVLLEVHGHGGSWMYAACLYCTYFGWIIVRICLPLYLIFVLQWKILPSMEPERRWCMYSGQVCAYFIALFCIVAFVCVLSKEVYLRWKSQPDLAKVALRSLETCPIKVDPQLQLSEDEMQLTKISPERMLLYQARERIKEMEDVVDPSRLRARTIAERRAADPQELSRLVPPQKQQQQQHQ